MTHHRHARRNLGPETDAQAPGRSAAGQERQEPFRAEAEAGAPGDPRGRRDPLRLAHGRGRARQSAPQGPQDLRDRERRAPPDRGRVSPSRSRPRSCGRTRSRRGSRPTPCIRGCWWRPIPCPRSISKTSRPKAPCWCSTRSPIRTMSARSCAPRRRSRVEGDRHHGAAFARGDRRARQVRVRRARSRADRDGAKSRARAHRTEGARLAHRRARQRRRDRSRGGSACASRSRWCSAPRARACARSRARPAISARGSTLPGAIKSLNVSNAAAVALYAAAQRLRTILKRKAAGLRPAACIKLAKRSRC